MWINYLANFIFRNAFSNAFFQGIILYVSSKNEYPENPTLARILSAEIEINDVDAC
jgi:hypothetical protein